MWKWGIYDEGERILIFVQTFEMKAIVWFEPYLHQTEAIGYHFVHIRHRHCYGDVSSYKVLVFERITNRQIPAEGKEENQMLIAIFLP